MCVFCVWRGQLGSTCSFSPPSFPPSLPPAHPTPDRSICRRSTDLELHYLLPPSRQSLCPRQFRLCSVVSFRSCDALRVSFRLFVPLPTHRDNTRLSLLAAWCNSFSGLDNRLLLYACRFAAGKLTSADRCFLLKIYHLQREQLVGGFKRFIKALLVFLLTNSLFTFRHGLSRFARLGVRKLDIAFGQGRFQMRHAAFSVTHL